MGAGAIALPAPSAGVWLRALAPVIGRLGLVVTMPLVLCGDSPCSPTVNQAKAHDNDPSDKRRQSKPTDAPKGTKPVDQSGLGREKIHDIKSRIGAGPKDYVGITPDGKVITTDPQTGQAVDEGHVSDF